MNDLLLLSPEIIIAFVAFAIFTLDIIWKGDRRSATILPWVAFSASIVALIAIFYIWPLASAEVALATDIDNLVPMMAVDRMALFFKMLSMLTVALVVLSAIDYINLRSNMKGEFYALTLLAGLSLMLMSGATNLVMIYLSIEFLSITSYVMTGYLREDDKSTEAALKYLLYGALASGVMLYGFSLLYGATGSVDLAGIAASLEGSQASTVMVMASMLLILTGFGFKIALVPFHQWSPDAYEGAPTPVTAFLSVGPKAAGIAVLIRVLVVALPAYDINWTGILAVVSILTMTVGNIVALWQTSMKRMLAYSSIAQAGYVIIGLAAWSSQPSSLISDGLNGMFLYLFAYLFTNLGVFAVVIVLENKTGTDDISSYAGLIRRSPMLSIALLVFFLSLIGIPPTGGFIGKLFVFSAAIDQQLYVLATIGVLNSVVSVFYYFGVIRHVFFNKGDDESPINLSFAMNAVVTITVVMTLLIALYGQPFIELATSSTQILASSF